MTDQHSYKKSTLIGVGADLRKSNQSAHYVDNAKFYEALVERQEAVKAAKEAGLPLPRVSEFIGKCLYDIADNLSQKYQFRNYPFRQDMVGDAAVHMTKYIDSFDVNFGKNPFSYFTMTAYYSFLETIRVEKKEMAVKFKLTLDKVATQEVSEHDDDYHQLMAEENMPDTSIMADFVSKYEVSLAKKKPVKEVQSPLDDFLE